MKQATKGWIERADGDFRAARFLLTAPEPVLEAVCFHAQQCVEKYLKALLQEHEIRFPRTHDVVVLARCSAPLLPELATLEADLDDLNVYAVEIRYPGVEVGQAKAQAALYAAEVVRQMVRHTLGLEASEG